MPVEMMLFAIVSVALELWNVVGHFRPTERVETKKSWHDTLFFEKMGRS